MYLVRIELHHAAYDDYQALYAEMDRGGFSRTVTGDDGTVYRLPTAEYYYYGGSRTCEQARDSAKAAADSTGNSSAVIVADAKELQWVGLAKA